MSEYRQYENGVADVVAFLLGDNVAVQRNAYMRGHLSESRRQVDVLVRGRLLGHDNATLIIDCKRWGSKIDVADVGAFIDLVKDVGADGGLLVTTSGATEGAQRRASAEGTVHLEVMDLDDLRAWRPQGTAAATYRIPAKKQEPAERALRNGGFRVVVASEGSSTTDEIALEVFRHYGVANPPGDVQAEHLNQAEDRFRSVGVKAILIAHGVTCGGGTPAHRWLKVVAEDVVTELKVLADTPEEAERQLDHIAPLFASMHIPRSALTVLLPEGWPVRGIFSFPS